MDVSRKRVDEILAGLPAAERLALEEYHEKLKTDPLTGICDRKKLKEEIVDLTEKARKGGLRQVVILMGDVNGLKELNDGVGHAHGDEVLRETAEALKHEDIVGRYGGDEFVIILPVFADRNGFNEEVLENRVREIGSRVDKRVAAMKMGFDGEWPQKRGRDAGTMSFGGKIFTAEEFLERVAMEGDVLGNLTKEADMRMYKDKNAR